MWESLPYNLPNTPLAIVAKLLLGLCLIDHKTFLKKAFFYWKFQSHLKLFILDQGLLSWFAPS